MISLRALRVFVVNRVEVDSSTNLHESPRIIRLRWISG
jgi:hypothetical protein